MALDDQGVNAMVGEAKRGREAYDAASYDQDWNLYFGGHGGWAFDTKDTKEGRLLVFLVKRSSYSSIHGYEVAVPLGRTASAEVAERNPRVFFNPTILNSATQVI